MGSQELRSVLRETDEVELTVTGRNSGQESSRPIWFVEEGDKLLLLPVTGSDSNWYRNIRKTPAVRLVADGADYSAEANPIDDPGEVARVVAEFSSKYGADRVKEYYPKTDAAVEVPLA